MQHSFHSTSAALTADVTGDVVGTIVGPVAHGAVNTLIAGRETKKCRRREKLYASTKGLKGFSRSKANKDVTKAWSGAVAGTGGGLAGGAVGGAIGGQVSYSRKYQIFSNFRTKKSFI